MEIRPEDFILTQNIQKEDVDYKFAEILIKHIKTAALLADKCFTIFDYYKNEYCYITDHPLFFPKTLREKKLGYGLLVDSSDQEGVYLMHCIQKRAYQFLLRKTPEERTNYIFSLNVSMVNGTTFIDTLYKIKPEVLDKKGNIWLSLATLEKTNTFIKPQVYNIKTEKVDYFKPLKNEYLKKNTEKLTNQELLILKSIAEEKSAQKICDELQIKEPTYKRHRSEIYRKLGVKSKISAVNRAYIYGIIE